MQTIPRRLKLLEKRLISLPANSDAMLVSELDGFLAGLLVCPDLILPSEWLPLVWGGDEETAPIFENARQAEQLVGLVMEHYNATANDLQSGRYAPVFEVDTRHGEVLWELWIGGFETAMQLRPESWVTLLDRDGRPDPGFLADRTGGLQHHRLGAQPRFFLYRGLNAAPLHEFLGRDHRQDLDHPACARRPARGPAQRHQRFFGVVHHDQI